MLSIISNRLWSLYIFHLDIIAYLDYLLVYAQNFEELLKSLPCVFEPCNLKGLKLKPEKCGLMAVEELFRGRIIIKEGVRFHPR